VSLVLVIAAATACGEQDAPTTSFTAATTAQSAYQATSILVDETRGPNTVKVNLPQVMGGSPAVRDRFNSGMRTALDDLAGPAVDTTIDDGTLMGDERSGVTTLGPHVVGGVAIFNWYAKGAAHPNNSVATIVIDAGTAKPVMLQDIWTDPQAAVVRLATVLPQIDDRVGALEPGLDIYANWVPTPDGFHVFVPVIHAMGDYLPVTVPWDKISDLMTPQMRTALAG